MGISISESEYDSICDKTVKDVNEYKGPGQDDITAGDLGRAGLYSFIVTCMNTSYNMNLTKEEENDLIRYICVNLGIFMSYYNHEHSLSAKDRLREHVMKIAAQDDVNKDDLKKLADIIGEMMDKEDRCNDQ